MYILVFICSTVIIRLRLASNDVGKVIMAGGRMMIDTSMLNLLD